MKLKFVGKIRKVAKSNVVTIPIAFVRMLPKGKLQYLFSIENIAAEPSIPIDQTKLK